MLLPVALSRPSVESCCGRRAGRARPAALPGRWKTLLAVRRRAAAGGRRGGGRCRPPATWNGNVRLRRLDLVAAAPGPDQRVWLARTGSGTHHNVRAALAVEPEHAGRGEGGSSVGGFHMCAVLVHVLSLFSEWWWWLDGAHRYPRPGTGWAGAVLWQQPPDHGAGRLRDDRSALAGDPGAMSRAEGDRCGTRPRRSPPRLGTGWRYIRGNYEQSVSPVATEQCLALFRKVARSRHRDRAGRAGAGWRRRRATTRPRLPGLRGGPRPRCVLGLGGGGGWGAGPPGRSITWGWWRRRRATPARARCADREGLALRVEFGTRRASRSA